MTKPIQQLSENDTFRIGNINTKDRTISWKYLKDLILSVVEGIIPPPQDTPTLQQVTEEGAQTTELVTFNGGIGFEGIEIINISDQGDVSTIDNVTLRITAVDGSTYDIRAEKTNG